MERIKSSLELAMEKLKKPANNGAPVETFSDTQEYLKAAGAIGRSFLKEKMSKEEVGEKFARYPENSRAAAINTFIMELVAKMNLKNTPIVLETIQYLREDQETGEICAAAEQLCHHFQAVEEEKLALLRATSAQEQREQLARAGIKGSAIAAFNVEGTAAWQKAQAQLETEYARALDDFRNSIKS